MSSVESLTRKELQSQLKAWKLPATGKTVDLRARYAKELAKRGGDATATTSAATVASSPSRKLAKSFLVNKPKEEKRLRRFRPFCPQQVQQRIHRAVTQRLYLVKREEARDLQCTFVVLGSTGNVYTVRVGHTATCTCPDHLKRKSLCKHILFVLLKVMGLPADSYLIYQAAWLSSELEEMFDKLSKRRVGGTVLANANVRNRYHQIQTGQDIAEEDNTTGVVRQSLDQESDCPICFDKLDAKLEPLTYCRAACGANFHAGCIQRWGSSANYYGGRKEETTCPNCRQPWETATSAKTDPTQEGYTNLGKLQGQSLKRDTSTYNTNEHYKYSRYY